MTRKARLRPQFADWYPGLPDGWHEAQWLAEKVRRQLSAGGPRWEPSQRVLDDRHFEFQGGRPGPPATKTDRRSQAPVSTPPTSTT
jgi:hypothetical protein